VLGQGTCVGAAIAGLAMERREEANPVKSIALAAAVAA
jgi:hypothetical protein